MIIPTLQYGALIDNCVSSILSGGYDGDIYVVSNIQQCESVSRFGSNIRFVYTNTTVAEPTDELIFKGYSAFNKKYDIIIYSHNDTTYKERWWGLLLDAWNSIDSDKVNIIYVPTTYDKINVNEPHHKLGFSFDLYNPNFSGRFSPCTSFVTSIYENTINKFGHDTYFSLELLMLYESIVEHKWSAMANTGCMINHKGNGDMGLSKDFGTYFSRTYTTWFNKFGYNLEHFISVWFGCVLNVHRVEILNAINSNNYSSVEHIFDGALKSINNINCSHCGLQCHVKNRVKQPYR